MYDIIIIGGGPSGLTAATYARRAGKQVLVIEKNAFGGQITWSPRVKNFPGYVSISGIELGDKLLEQEYRGCLKTNLCEEWVKIIKTTYFRKLKRLQMGRKVTAVDAKYSRIAEDSLYGELALVLDMPKEKVADYIASEIEKDSSK